VPFVPLFAFGRANVLVSREDGHVVDLEHLGYCLPQVLVQTHVERSRFVPGVIVPTAQVLVE